MPNGDYDGCTCYRPWMSILPPPPCPAHNPLRYLHVEQPSWTWTTTTTNLPTPRRGKPKSRKHG